jgi:SAM-dependent methyltransferase
LSHFSGQVRVLEIGPGTGQATRSLLDHGAHVTAMEPGIRMSAFLRQKFATETLLDVVNAKFEEVAVSGPFDIVFGATSFHWVAPRVRLEKSHSLLRPNGALAVVSTNQVRSDADRGYFAACQPIYRKYFPDETPPPPSPTASAVTPDEFAEINASDLFGKAWLFRYPWDQTYSSDEYGLLLRSYSGTNMMEPDAREGLVAELCALADREFGGSVTRPLVITLTLAFRQ